MQCILLTFIFAKNLPNFSIIRIKSGIIHPLSTHTVALFHPVRPPSGSCWSACGSAASALPLWPSSPSSSSFYISNSPNSPSSLSLLLYLKQLHIWTTVFNFSVKVQFWFQNLWWFCTRLTSFVRVLHCIARCIFTSSWRALLSRYWRHHFGSILKGPSGTKVGVAKSSFLLEDHSVSFHRCSWEFRCIWVHHNVIFHKIPNTTQLKNNIFLL